MISRRGNLAFVALGCLMIASIGAFSLATVSQGNLRQAGLMKNETQLRWAAHAALATFANHVKMNSWENRFYRDSKNTSEYTTAMTYRGRSLSLWARDSVRAGVVQTQTIDVFARVADSDLVMGTYQRIRIISSLATNPRTLRVLRELTVRDDFEGKSVRDRVLKGIEEDERSETVNGPEGDVYARAIDASAEKDSPPDQAIAEAMGVTGEVATEQRFQEAMAKAHALMGSGSLVDVIACLNDAMQIAASSGTPQGPQRRMACELAMARAQYALGLTSSEPDRSKSLTQASDLLDRLIKDLGPGCAGPTAALLRAQVRMVQNSTRSGTERSQPRDEVIQELRSTLAAIAPGQAFEGGSVPVDDLVEEFSTSWSLPVAYTDSFVKIVPDRALGDLRVPVVQRLSLTDEDGTPTRPITLNGLMWPLMWLPGGSALLVKSPKPQESAKDAVFDRRGTVALVDRTGTVLQSYPKIDPWPTQESGGLALTPKGDQLVYFGYTNDDNTEKILEKTLSYWVQDLKGGPPKRILGSYTSKETLAPSHDPIRFSSDGKQVAYFVPNEGVKTAESSEFLQGSPSGKTVFPPNADWEYSPGILWVQPTPGVKTDLLVVYANASDLQHPERGHLVLVDPATGSSNRSPTFPNDFSPSVVIPHRDKPRLTILSENEKRCLTIDFGASGFASSFEEKTMSCGFFDKRPGRGVGNEVYLEGPKENPGLFRWDVATGDPVRILQPSENGPTPISILIEPVVY